MRKVLGITVLVALVGAVVFLSVVAVMVGKSRREASEIPSDPALNQPAVRSASSDVEKLCGTCHKLPPPD